MKKNLLYNMLKLKSNKMILVRKKPTKVIKVGRNDPCPCGSGKKYKKMLWQIIFLAAGILSLIYYSANLVSH